MPTKRKTRLTPARKRLICKWYKYIWWIVNDVLSDGLRDIAISRLGSIEDVAQHLFYRLCQSIASLSEMPWKKKIPCFIKDQLIADLINYINYGKRLLLDKELLLSDLDNGHCPLCTDEGGVYSTPIEEIFFQSTEDPYNKAASNCDVDFLLRWAGEPNRTIIYRRIVLEESMPKIARDFGITKVAVAYKVDMWIKTMRAVYGLDQTGVC
jgi:hypothetical protein